VAAAKEDEETGNAFVNDVPPFYGKQAVVEAVASSVEASEVGVRCTLPQYV